MAKQLAENSSGSFRANTEKNPKEECKAVMTRGKKETMVENEGRVTEEKELVIEEGEEENEKENHKRICMKNTHSNTHAYGYLRIDGCICQC